MDCNTEIQNKINLLAKETSVDPTNEDMEAFTAMFFSMCKRFKIDYAAADAKGRYFVEEVTRVTGAKQKERETGIQVPIRPAFS